MPYRLEWEDKHVIFEYFGEVTANDFLHSNQVVYGDERFDHLRWQIVAFDEVTSWDFSPQTVKHIRYMDNAAALTNPQITVCFVGASEKIEEIGTAYVEAGAEQTWPVLHFETMEAAIEHVRK